MNLRNDIMKQKLVERLELFPGPGVSREEIDGLITKYANIVDEVGDPIERRSATNIVKSFQSKLNLLYGKQR